MCHYRTFSPKAMTTSAATPPIRAPAKATAIRWQAARVMLATIKKIHGLQLAAV
jgi:hypothetical protein